MKQVEQMGKLIKKYGNDENSIIKDYAEKEEQGVVVRKSDKNKIPPIEYARRLYFDVKNKNLKKKQLKKNFAVFTSQVQPHPLDIQQPILPSSGNLNCSLSQCYEEISKISNLQNKLESLKVIEKVDAYRNYWRPNKTNVILLAESHVYTQDFELNYKIVLKDNYLNDYPENYVRFAY